MDRVPSKAVLTRWLPLTAGLFALVGGLTSLLGVFLSVPRLTDWVGSGISIKANTSLAIAALGGSLSMLAYLRRFRWMASVLSIFACCVGAATLFEHLSGTDLGIDTLLWAEPPGALATSEPGRMGLPACVSILVLGLALSLMVVRSGHRWASYLGTAILGIASLSLVGYMFGADQLYSMAQYTGIAFQTAIMLFALAAGVVGIACEFGIVAALIRDDAGGLVFRRLVVPAMFASLILGWFRAEGQRVGLYNTEFGTAARTIIDIYLLFGLLWLTTRSISRFERQNTWLARLPGENPEPVIRLATNGDLLYENGASRQLSIDWTSKDENSSAAMLRSAAANALKSGTRHKADITIGGRTFESTFAPIPESEYVNIYCSDITERRRSEDLQHARMRELAVLYQLSDRLNRSSDVAEFHDAALAAITEALECSRASILLFDDAGVMSFVASKGLSEEYRHAVNGHSPWKQGDTDAKPFGIADIAASDQPDELKAVIEKEGIKALGFIPLIANSVLIGKFMVYYDHPHQFTDAQLELSATIANQIAFGVERRRIEERRQQTEAALRENDARLRLATRTGKVGIWDWDIAADHVTWSDSLYAMHGIAPAAFSGTAAGFSDLVHPDDREKIACGIRDALEGTAPYELEFRIKRPDTGEVMWLFTSATVIRDDADKPVRMIGATVDINERIQAEMESRKLASIVETSRDAIVGKDLTSTITSWNNSAEALFGYSASEAIGRSIMMIIPEERHSEETLILDKISKGEVVDSFETVRRRKDGTLIDVSLTISPIRDASGQVIGASKFARDITEKKLAESARRESEIMHRLVAAQEGERHRIARDLHDHLGQQLTALRLKLETVRSKVVNEPELLRDIVSTQEIASKVDTDVNFLSWELRPTELEQLGLKDAVGSFVREWSVNYGIAATFQAAETFTNRFDPEFETNIYRIVQEALNNILKHAKAANVDILLEQRRDQAVLVIEDDGVGFNEQGPRKRSENGAGGLGLVGMRERAALLGGSLEIESQPGGGTSIFARVPMRPRNGRH